MLIGITHTRDGQPIIREPRVLKVGIGIPQGRAISIYIHGGKWLIWHGAWDKGSDGKNKLAMKLVATCNNREEAEAFHAAHKQEAAVSNRPQKLPFFTFTRRSVVNDGGKLIEVFDPDFAVIEAHGERTREIDVVLMGDNPHSSEYQMWSAAELKCHGDGVKAERVLSMGNEQMPGWSEAKVSRLKMFPVSPCWTDGCQYAADGGGCKPGVTLNFQLANSMRIGATAYFHTTSIRSASQIFSSLETIRIMAGRVGASLVGLPLKMVLAPFRSNHKGQSATQYAVSLELRAEDMASLRMRLADAVWVPQQIAAGALREYAEPEPMPELSAPSMAAEFYPGSEDEDAVTVADGPPMPRRASEAPVEQPAPIAEEPQSGG